ncbi:MAG: GTP cyclohydrolase I, partial [Paramuribaculum sp.]|nr:GTP cyclohydrolase I [Paramuribaculum sp.]
QERLTDEICKAVGSVLPTDGVMVSIPGEHLCMKMRGVEKQDSATVTIATSGRFADDPALRAEFLAAIR